MAKSYILSTIGALAIRTVLYMSPYREEISNRVEVTTPVNSMYKLKEGLYREQLGIDPYSSDLFHESPLHLLFYKYVMKLFGEYLFAFFLLCDMATAYLVYLTANRYMFQFFMKQSKDKPSYNKEAQRLVVYGIDFAFIPSFAFNVYLFNPYTILNCVAQTTTVVANLCQALFFVGLTYRLELISIISLVVWSCQTLYPIVFISPLFLSVNNRHGWSRAFFAIFLFFFGTGMFLVACWQVYGNWMFLDHSYGFVLKVLDQQPNVGVFWYFFTEMFQQFRLLFIVSYQINSTILYMIPITLKFRRDPLVVATSFSCILTLFRSYPCIGDIAFTLAILAIWSYIFHTLQYIFITSVAIIVTTVLSPVLWDLWIHWGSANANYYFGITLASVTSFIFMLSDYTFNISRYEFLLKFGSPTVINNRPVKAILD